MDGYNLSEHDNKVWGWEYLEWAFSGHFYIPFVKTLLFFYGFFVKQLNGYIFILVCPLNMGISEFLTSVFCWKVGERDKP